MALLNITTDKKNKISFSMAGSMKELVGMILDVMDKKEEFKEMLYACVDVHKAKHLKGKRKALAHFHPEYSDLDLIGFKSVAGNLVIDLTNETVDSRCPITLMMIDNSHFLFNFNGTITPVMFHTISELKAFVQGFKPTLGESEKFLCETDGKGFKWG